MPLTSDEQKTLREVGAVVVPGVIPSEAADRALRRINHELSTINMSEQGPNYGFMKEVGRSDPILDLYRATPLHDLADWLIAPGAVDCPASAHMALRFPVAPDVSENPDPPEGWHPARTLGRLRRGHAGFRWSRWTCGSAGMSNVEHGPDRPHPRR